MQNMQIPGFCGAEIQDAGGVVVPDIFQRRPNVDKWRNRAGAVGVVPGLPSSFSAGLIRPNPAGGDKISSGSNWFVA